MCDLLDDVGYNQKDFFYNANANINYPQCIKIIKEKGFNLNKSQYNSIGVPFQIDSRKPEWNTYCDLAYNFGLCALQDILLDSGIAEIDGRHVTQMSKKDICHFLADDYKKHAITLLPASTASSSTDESLCKNPNDILLTPFNEIDSSQYVIDSLGYCFSKDDIDSYKSTNSQWPSKDDTHVWLSKPFKETYKPTDFDKFKQDCDRLFASTSTNVSIVNRDKLHQHPKDNNSYIRDFFMSMRQYNEYLNSENYIDMSLQDYTELYEHFSSRFPQLRRDKETYMTNRLKFLKDTKAVINDDRLFASELGVIMNDIEQRH